MLYNPVGLPAICVSYYKRLALVYFIQLKDDKRVMKLLLNSREWEKQQRLQVQAMVGRLQEMVEQDVRARSAAAAERLGLPPSIQLPDGEYGQDVHLQLRVPYQVLPILFYIISSLSFRTWQSVFMLSSRSPAISSCLCTVWRSQHGVSCSRFDLIYPVHR